MANHRQPIRTLMPTGKHSLSEIKEGFGPTPAGLPSAIGAQDIPAPGPDVFSDQADRQFFAFLGKHPWLQEGREDLFQDYCCAMLAAASRFDAGQGAHQAHYTLACGYGTLMEQARRSAIRHRTEAPLEDQEWTSLAAILPAHDLPDPLDTLIKRENQTALDQALAALPAGDRALFLTRSGYATVDGRPEKWSVLAGRHGASQASLRIRFEGIQMRLRSTLGRIAPL